MSKNKKILDSFVAYCEANPELRFWQALRNWSRFSFILGSIHEEYKLPVTIDTFYFEGKDS